jgi:hypothetical protein
LQSHAIGFLVSKILAAKNSRISDKLNRHLDQVKYTLKKIQIN